MIDRRAVSAYNQKRVRSCQSVDVWTGSFEKVGSLGTDLPRNDEDITTTTGDVILYQGNQITIYYDENRWNFTKLGHIDIGQDELKTILGSGDVTVILSLNP